MVSATRVVNIGLRLSVNRVSTYYQKFLERFCDSNATSAYPI